MDKLVAVAAVVAATLNSNCILTGSFGMQLLGVDLHRRAGDLDFLVPDIRVVEDTFKVAAREDGSNGAGKILAYNLNGVKVDFFEIRESFRYTRVPIHPASLSVAHPIVPINAKLSYILTDIDRLHGSIDDNAYKRAVKHLHGVQTFINELQNVEDLHVWERFTFTPRTFEDVDLPF